MGVYEVVMVGLLLFPWSFVLMMSVGALWRGAFGRPAQAPRVRFDGQALRCAAGEICR